MLITVLSHKKKTYNAGIFQNIQTNLLGKC